MLTAFTNSIIISGGKEQSGKAVLVENGIIKAVLPASEVPSTARLIDLKGAYLAPGLIDLQIYGSGEKLFGGNPSSAALQQMESDLLAQGCTGFLATVATNTNQIVENAIASAKAYRKNALGNFLGLHLEGPYLNPKRKGAHPETCIKKGSIDEIKGWIDDADGEIKMMTIAPELQDQDVIDYLHNNGIIISAGHSNASFNEAMLFLNNPVKAATHLYNAMPQMHHREPGLIPAIFKAKPFTSIVADGIHVSFPMIELAKRELGNRLFLITDAVTATTEGAYPHIFKGDRYVMPDGTLSGSCLTMLQAVKNCVEEAGILLTEAIQMASAYPAEVLGADQYTGKIEVGYRANMITFNVDFELQNTYLAGKNAFAILSNWAV